MATPSLLLAESAAESVAGLSFMIESMGPLATDHALRSIGSMLVVNTDFSL